MFAGNPMAPVVNEIEYLASYIEDQSFTNLNSSDFTSNRGEGRTALND